MVGLIAEAIELLGLIIGPGETIVTDLDMGRRSSFDG